MYDLRFTCICITFIHLVPPSLSLSLYLSTSPPPSPLFLSLALSLRLSLSFYPFLYCPLLSFANHYHKGKEYAMDNYCKAKTFRGNSKDDMSQLQTLLVFVRNKQVRNGSLRALKRQIRQISINSEVRQVLQFDFHNRSS